MEVLRSEKNTVCLLLSDNEVNALEEIAFANDNAKLEDFFFEILSPIIAIAVQIVELVHKEGDNK